MIDVVSYAKKKESAGSGGSGVGGGIGGSQISTLEPHLLWGQVYDGRHDISGDLVGVGNIESDGSISAKAINTQTGKIDSVTGQELRYTTIIGGSISATDSTITNLTTTNHTSQSLTTTNLNSDTGTITDLSTQTHNTQSLTAKGVETERLTGKDIVVDNLTVNKAAHFFSLSVDEIKATQGQIIVTPASAIIEKVEVLASGDYRCRWKNTDNLTTITTQTFSAGDFVVCQTFNTGQSRYYWRLCTEAGSSDGWNYITLSKTDKDPASVSEPMKGDNIVQLGNRTDTTRQAAIIISAYNTGYLDKTVVAPSIVQYQGINDYNLETHRLNVISVGKNIFSGEFRVDNGKSLEQFIADRIKLTASGTPYIGNNNNWWIWDKDQSKYKDSGISAAGRDGQDGLTPRIVNNVWWIGNTNTGISAVGQKGDKGDRGEKGERGSDGQTPRIVENFWWVGNTNTGISAQGERGRDGRDLDPTPYYKLYDRGGSVAVVDTNNRLSLNIDLGLIEVVGQSASSVSSDNTPANKIQYKGGLIGINSEGRFKHSQELPYTGQTTFTFNLLSGDKLVDSYTIPVTVLPSTVFSVTDQIKAQVQDTKQSINNVTGRIGTVENKVTQLTQTADTIKTQVQSNKSNLDTVTGKIRQAESSISSLTQKAGSIEQTVAGTRTELDNLKNTTTRDINTLRQTASETESKVSRVEETIRDFSVGGQNLLNGVIDFRQPTPLLHTSKDKDGYFYYRGVTCELLAGKKYTLQIKSDGVLARGHEKQGDKSFTVWLCGKSDNLLFTSENAESDCVWTFTCPTTDKYILRLNSYSDGVKYESIKFWDIKLEEGNIVSGWSPSSSDLYNYYSRNRVGFDFVQNFPNDHHPAQSISYNHSTDTLTMSYNISRAGGQLQDIDYTVLFDSNSYAIPNGQYLVRFTPYLSAADVRLLVEIDNKAGTQTPIDYSQPAHIISGSEVSRVVEVKDNYLRIYFESAHQAGQDTTRDWSIALTGLKVVRINSTESYLKQNADLIEARVRDGNIILDAKKVKIKNGNNETALFENGKIKTRYIESQGGLFSVSDDGFYYRGTVKDVENETVETKIHNHGLSTRVDETVLKDGIFQSVKISPYSRDTNIDIVSNSQEAVSISSVSNNLEAAISITDGAVYGLRNLTRRYKGGNYTLDTYVKNVIVTGASDLENQVLGNQGTNLQLPDNDLLTKGMLSPNPTSAERVKYINKYHSTPENLQAGQEYIIYKRSSGRLVISVDDDPHKKISIVKYNQGSVEVVKSVLFTVNWVGIIKVLYDGQNWNLYVDSTNY
nr:MAG TPA: chromosome segregation protein [Caudoviricetes sp.]